MTMKNEILIKQILDQDGAKSFPENSSVVMPVLHQITGNATEGKRSFWRMPVTAILLAIIGVAVIATVGFAVYHFFFDPGLQGVKDAGLGANLNNTAQPTLNPPMPTESYQPLPATMVGSDQTINGITVSLDWISINQMRVLFGFSAEGLLPGMTFDLPRISFNGFTPDQFSGAAFELEGGQVVTGEFISYQVLNDLHEDEKVTLGIDLPLSQVDGNQNQSVSVFHFDLKDIPTNTGQPASGQQTYFAKVNGLGIRMDWIQLKPDSITAKICYDIPSSSGDWKIGNLTLETGSGNYTFDGGSPRAAQLTIPSKEGTQDCVNARLPMEEKEPPQLLKLSINELSSSNDIRLGPWDFYVMLPEKGLSGRFSDIIATTPEVPLAVETVGDLKATLMWAYADANRVAMQIHFDGWKDNYFLGGLTLKDTSGNDINTGYGSMATAEDPTTQMIELNPDPEYLLSSPFEFQMILPVYTRQGQNQANAIASFTFDLSLPVYQAKTYTFDSTLTTGGLEVRLLKAVMTPSYTDLTLCFTKPTHGDWSDWMIGYTAELQIGENKATGGGGGVIYDTDFGGYVTKGSFPRDLPENVVGRCIIAGFPIGDLAKPGPLEMVLTIPELQISMPEGFPDERINAAITQLRAEGIEMSFFTSSGSGGGGGGYTFTAKPQGMTDEEAYHKFLEALGFIAPGPWVFKVQIP
jgi:hypothetical protein